MMDGSLNTLYRRSLQRISKHNNVDTKKSIDEVIQTNKDLLGLSHGKGVRKRRKHKNKK